MTEQDLTRLRIAVAEQVLNSTLDWDHTYQKSVIGDDPKADTQTCNNGRGIWMSCSGCELNGPANEVDWAQRCKAPHTDNYPVDFKAAWQVFTYICNNWLYSKRKKFFDALQDQARLPSGDLAAWPDVLVVLVDKMPEAICKAAYKAVTGKDWK
jgi:hypothetical protein